MWLPHQQPSFAAEYDLVQDFIILHLPQNQQNMPKSVAPIKNATQTH
jgi:hypothetical protein